MSLKAIKELLSSYEDCIGKSDSEIGTAAQAEIAALEKAAKAYDEAERGGHSPEALEDAHRLMLAIAKEAE